MSFVAVIVPRGPPGHPTRSDPTAESLPEWER